MMKILVANIGSTSFKYRLFEMGGDGGAAHELARGGADRIGGRGGRVTWQVPPAAARSVDRACADHGEAVAASLEQLADDGVLAKPGGIAGVGFKAVMGGEGPSVCRVDEALLARLSRYAAAAPAHNPPQAAAMRALAERLGDVPLVAAFDSGFHETIPERRRRYAVPAEWAERYGIRRYGYHGASHRYVNERMAELTGRGDLRLISCHLGGSSSVCASRGGRSVAASMGFSPQSGLPQGTRAGEFDPFALAVLAAEAGMSLEAILSVLGGQSGLAALSGTGGDARDIEAGAEAGDAKCRLALEVYTTAIRDALGAYLVELGGTDAIAFAGGIGEKSPRTRRGVLSGLEPLGIVLGQDANEAAREEGRIDAADSGVQIWVVPTNEELIVARQTAALLAAEAEGGEGR